MSPTEYNPPLQVAVLKGSQRGDTERGPEVRVRHAEASFRLMQDGELVWVVGPRRQEIATLRIDDSLPRGMVALRDVIGASPSEIVRLRKVDTDIPPSPAHLA